MKNQTINEAIGIDNDTGQKMHSDTWDAYKRNDTHADAILDLIKLTKNDCFGSHDAPISDYEKRLFMMGMNYGMLTFLKNNIGKLVANSLLNKFLNTENNESESI